jgi:putative hydrolase of the HAD superfamily
MTLLSNGSALNGAGHADFSHVDTWVFDLDNTLYPAGSALWPQIDERITLYLCELFGLDGLSARHLQKYYYQRHGTTLTGLIDEKAGDIHEFLAFVHDIDRSSLAHDLPLGAAIGALPGRKLILTNGSVKHAEETARALGILDLFHDIFDIAAADFIPKPQAATYERFFDRHGVDPTRSAMFEDLVRNLAVPHERGMRTVLVTPRVGTLDNRESWEQQQPRLPHVDHVTDDLPSFLRSLTPAA